MRTLLLAGLLMAGTTPAPSQPAPDMPGPVAASDPALEDEVRSFLEAFIDGENSPAQQLAFFAEQVHYYDQGLVSRNTVAKDIEYTMRRWPWRENRLVEIEYLQTIAGEDKVFVSYVVDYDVAARGRAVRGTARYGAVIGDIGEQPRIEGIFENVTRRKRLPGVQ